MKIINVNAAYPADGKSCIIRLLADDFKNISRKVLIIDNSPEMKSGFRRMFDLNNIAGIDDIRAFLKGSILGVEQLGEIVVNLEDDIDYIANSEIESLETEDLRYILSLIETMKKYDIVIIENCGPIKDDRFDIINTYITRPCEKILSNIKSIKIDYDYIIVNKFEKDFNMNCKKLGVYSISYDKEIVLMDNGYRHNLSSQTSQEIKAITGDILGFMISEDVIEKARNKRIFDLFRR